MTMIRSARGLLLGAAAAALTLSLAGCGLLESVLGPGDAERDETGQVVEEQTVGIFSIKVGDCLPEGAVDGLISEAPVVPCSEPHADEVYFEFHLEHDEFPTEDEFWDAFDEQCLPAFEDFIGIPWEDSTLDVFPLSPTEESWSEGDDRLVQCLVYDPAGNVEGSLRGAER